MVKMWKEILEQPRVLEACLKNNQNMIQNILATIERHSIDNVVIAARGTSDHAGVYGKYIIEYRLGIPVSLAAPSIFTIYKKTLNLKHSLVIGISQSGEAEDVLEVVKSAYAQGAITIGITNNVHSPLSRESLFHLFTDAGDEKSVAATKTFTSQLMLLAQLVAMWSRNENMRNELNQIPENVQEVIKSENTIKEMVRRYRYMEECFVLSRGINYSIALEAALKIQETNYVSAKGYAVSDFHHGPFAMINKDMPVIVFAPKGPTLNDTKAMINKLNLAQAEVIVVSDNQELLQMGKECFHVPQSESDIVSPFYNVVFAQMFACQLALVKGLNPDSPRGLSKVTITR